MTILIPCRICRKTKKSQVLRRFFAIIAFYSRTPAGSWSSLSFLSQKGPLGHLFSKLFSVSETVRKYVNVICKLLWEQLVMASDGVIARV